MSRDFLAASCFVLAAFGAIFLFYSSRVKNSEIPPKSSALMGQRLPTSAAKHYSAKEQMVWAKGVQVYCNEKYHFNSCAEYLFRCGEDCKPLVLSGVKRKLASDLNVILAKNGKPLIKIPNQTSVIGQ